MKNEQAITTTALSSPRGAGAMTGMGESFTPVGSSGKVNITIPLPISAGRTLAPALGLAYDSGAGNGPFGVGWTCAPAQVSRRTSTGVPQYFPVGSEHPQDTFLGPDGELLVPETDAAGRVVTVTTRHYGAQQLDGIHSVTRYYPRTEGLFERLEYWVDAGGRDFWLIHGRDGTLHMLGKTDAARVFDPSQPLHTAAWLLEETLSANGDDMWYQYRSDHPLPRAGANRYLRQVSYGNRLPAETLFLWRSDTPGAAQSWLFNLVFDYGERGVSASVIPDFIAVGEAPVRPDAFSRYDHGFEIRTHYLCRQVLMFHCFPELGGEPLLISRLLLEYQADSSVSLLTGVQLLAYEPQGEVQAMPPLDLGYTVHGLAVGRTRWLPLDNFHNLGGKPLHWVDLYGEGLPGVLYRQGSDWQYRAPVRLADGPDRVGYAPAQQLPRVPSLQDPRFQLLDINGDGRLDWMVAQPGLAGFFSLNPDGTWGDFQPLAALPVEYFHPHAQLTQLIGNGLADLVLMGPRNVRLYANQRTGFAAGITVSAGNDVVLPVAGPAAQTLVAFADVLGSGQPHLVQIAYNQVRCWPNLGRGRFGDPVDLPLPEEIAGQASFNPDRVFLADITGSGTADLLYARQDMIQVWVNQSGNGFSSGSVIALPPGVMYSDLCDITFADTLGQGCTELILSVPGAAQPYWRLQFIEHKPCLLATVANNMGASTAFTYRHSSQYWLDEKAENPAAVASLPLSMPVLSTITVADEVTGNVLGSTYKYRQGVYDGRGREFRGFAYVETLDTHRLARATHADIPPASPLLTRAWYHCGREFDETRLHGRPFNGDGQAPALKPTRLSHYHEPAGQDIDLPGADEQTQWWLHRALRGSVLRSESWPGTQPIEGETPYACTFHRYQVRRVQPGAQPVAMPATLETVTISYEQQPRDPAVRHQVLLRMDRYGTPLWEVEIAYPRRPLFIPAPYPANLPADAWAGTYDSQQQVVRITERRISVYHLDTPQYHLTAVIPRWAIALPALERSNTLTLGALPVQALSYETLMAAKGPISPSTPRKLVSQVETCYPTLPPQLPLRASHVRTAVLDKEALQAYADTPGCPPMDAPHVGYVAWQTALDVTGAQAQPLWASDGALSTYDDSAHFYRQLTRQSTALGTLISLQYDPYSLMPIRQVDGLGNTTTNILDYRFVASRCMTDINRNTHEVQFNALGQIVNASTYGTEGGGIAVGFKPVQEAPTAPSLTVQAAIDQALATGHVQKTASVTIVDLFSWMGRVSLADLSTNAPTAQRFWQTLLAARLITDAGHIRAAGRHWARQPDSNPEVPQPLAAVLLSRAREPVHTLTKVADNYPGGAAAQQIHLSVTHNDGFGRILQQARREAPGEAWQWQPGGNVNTQAVYAEPRWAVSGRVEYDGKGQAVRAYQPYFINDWRYVAEPALRKAGFSDTLRYDPLGRESHAVTALGYLRRNSYYPWFTVAEDERDTQGLSERGIQ